jgi:hypothetical protein
MFECKILPQSFLKNPLFNRFSYIKTRFEHNFFRVSERAFKAQQNDTKRYKFKGLPI